MRVYLRAAILVCLMLVAVGSLLRFSRVSYFHLKAPHDICFESHNLASIKSVQAGANIYDKDFYGDVPFIITIYTPLFHYLVASLPELSTNPFFVGRLISLISTMLAAMLLLVPGGVKRNLGYAFSLMALFFLLRLTVRYASYLRSDTMGMFLSGAAIVLLDRGYPKKPFLVLSAFLCFLAFLSKQSFIAASITCCFFLMLKSRKAGLFFAVVLGSLYATFAVFAQSYWGSGFWFSVFFSVTKTPAIAILPLLHWKHMLGEPLLAFLCLLTGLTIFCAFQKGKSGILRESPYPAYLFSSLATGAVSAAKLGSSENCFLELVLALLLWSVYITKKWDKELGKNLVKKAIITLFFFLAGMELLFAKSNLYSFTDAETIALREKAYAAAKEEIEELNPVNDHFVTLNSLAASYKVQSGAYLNDPFNYWMMWENEILDVSCFTRAIQEKRFSLILIVDAEKNPYGIPSMPHFPPGPALEQIKKALSENYVFRRRGVFLYFMPHTPDMSPRKHLP